VTFRNFARYSSHATADWTGPDEFEQMHLQGQIELAAQKCNGKHSVLQFVAMGLSRSDQIGQFLASPEHAIPTKKAGRLRGADPLRFQLTSRTSHEGREA
jgi:hypothetical protein